MLRLLAAVRRDRNAPRMPRWPRLGKATPAWVVLSIPIAALMIGVVSLTAWLAFYNGERAVSQLLERYKQEIVVHVQQELNHCLDVPHQINETNAAAIALGLIDFDDPMTLEKYFWHQLQQFSAVNYIYAGNESGGIIGVGRNAEGELRIYETEDFTQGDYLLYRADDSGSRQERLDVSENYDARIRPWYQASAASTDEEVWSDVYLFVGEPLLGIAASRPIIDAAGNRRGVVATDLVLTQIGEFLKAIPVRPSNTLFIMERSGDLVATSASELPFITVAPGEQQQRRHASESQDPLTHAAYEQLIERFQQLTNIHQPEDLSLIVDGDRHFLYVVPFSDGRGLDWLITMVMPEKNFMAQIHRNTRHAIGLCVVAVMLAIALSIAIARRMSRPLRQLSEASRALAQGEFSRRLPTYRTRELNVLSGSFNRMAQRLQGLFKQLAERNTQLESRVEERTAHLTRVNYQLQLLLRSVSHDLRNPIMGTLMVLNMIREQDQVTADPGRSVVLPQHVLDTLISSSERQLRLVNSLLDDHGGDGPWAIAPADGELPDLSTVTSLLEKRSLSLHPQSLHQIVDQVVQDVQPLLVRHQTALTVALPETLPPVLADPDQLWRVVENLVSNGITHNPPKTQITITADMMTSSRIGPMVCCKVTDDGAGIAIETQKSLFEPYRRGDDHAPGMGLGLYVCRKIIEAHRGTVGVFSRPGAGATFWFTLPAVLSEPTPRDG